MAYLKSELISIIRLRCASPITIVNTFLMYGYLKLGKLLGLGGGNSNLQDVESNSLRDRSALPNGNNVTLRDSESRRNVSRQVLVSLLVSVVFGNVVQVFSSDDNGSVHLGGDNSTGQNLTSDGDVTDEWALFVDVGSLNGGLGRLETQTNILVPSLGSSVSLGLWVVELVRLL